MHHVYIIQSRIDPRQIYKGYTTNIRKRILDHNHGKSVHTNKYRPWKLLFFASFAKKKTAMEFERYLKSSSGRAFTSKRLTPSK